MKSSFRAVLVAVSVFAAGAAALPAEAAWPWPKSKRAKPADVAPPDPSKPPPTSEIGPDGKILEPSQPALQSLEETLYVPPKPEKVTLPVYPYELLKQRVTGEASVACMVNTEGHVVRVDVLDATRPEFAAALTAAIEATPFAYATREGEPIVSVLGFKHRFDTRRDEDREDLRLLEKADRSPHILGKPAKLDRPLRAKAQPPPAFPTLHLRRGSEGSAVIEFLLDENGETRLPRVIRASDPAFGYAAAHAVAQWKFEPPTAGGEPAVMRVSVPFFFRVQ